MSSNDAMLEVVATGESAATDDTTLEVIATGKNAATDDINRTGMKEYCNYTYIFKYYTDI
jgi:hypothetical protein